MRVFHGHQHVTPEFFHAVMVIGNFDGVHLGHQELIRRATLAAQGAPVIVYTFSPHPRKVPLLMTEEQKWHELEKLGVDAVIAEPFVADFSQIRATEFIDDILLAQLHTYKVVVGGNFRFGRGGEGDAKLLRNHGIACQIVPTVMVDAEPCSSTRIRHYIQNGNVEKAARLLGRSYSLTGKIIHGSGRGQRIGIPTANLNTQQELIPHNGVYTTRMRVKDNFYRGATNIGRRPTFGNNDTVHIETHLLGFNGNLYDQNIELFFDRHIRDEMKFNSVDELKLQIERDLQSSDRSS